MLYVVCCFFIEVLLRHHCVSSSCVCIMSTSHVISSTCVIIVRHHQHMSSLCANVILHVIDVVHRQALLHVVIVLRPHHALSSSSDKADDCFLRKCSGEFFIICTCIIHYALANTMRNFQILFTAGSWLGAQTSDAQLSLLPIVPVPKQ